MDVDNIKSRLEEIYNMIPLFNCQGCHQCCGLIHWSIAEEQVIRQHMKKHNIEYKKWELKDYEKNDFQCPYVQDNKCIIYQVRPLVCRLQGHIPELPCPNNKINDISQQKVDIMWRKMKKLDVGVAEWLRLYS